MRPFVDNFKCDEHLIMSRSLTYSEVSGLGVDYAIPPAWKQREWRYWEAILIPEIEMEDHPEYAVFDPVYSYVINLKMQRQFDSLLTTPAASLGTYVLYLSTHWPQRISMLQQLGWSNQRIDRTKKKEMKWYLSFHTVATATKS